MFRDGTQLEEFSLCVLLKYGGLGDMINRLPAILYLYEQTQHVRQYVFCHDYLYELLDLVFKDKRHRIHLMPMSAYEGWIERDWCKAMPYVDFKPTQLSSSKPHLTEYGFLNLIHKLPENKELWNLPQPDLTNTDVSSYDIPERYGILCTGYTARVRAWPTNEVEEVARFMIQSEITPVYLGKKGNDLGNGAKNKASFTGHDLPGVDLRDQTSIPEALKIISKAKFIAGVDNGLLHLAYMSDTPVVAGFTSISPNYRVPYRNGKQYHKTIVVEPDKELECSGCETKQQYLVRHTQKGILPHDYKVCPYNDYKCVTQMRASKFIDAIKQVIGHKAAGSRQGKWDDISRSKKL